MSEEDSDIIYIHMNGGTALLLGKHKYHLLKKYKNAASIWRCSNYKKTKCFGTVTIKGSDVQNRKEHSCTPDINKNATLREIAELKEIVKKTDEPIPKLYEDKLLQMKNNGIQPFVIKLPPFSNVSRSLYDARNKANGVPKTTFRKVENVIVPAQFHDYILGDFYDNGNRILVFCHSNICGKLKYIKEIFIDGTFSSCPIPFSQLYSIHGDLGSSVEKNNVVPLIFALMTDKRTDSYYILFSLIKSQLPGFNPTKVHCDYELAPVNAIKKVYPDIIVKGCYYHWTRCVWRKAKFYGHTKCKAEKRIIALTAALPLIPQENIRDGFQYIIKECGEDIKMPKFIQYVKSFWLKPYFSGMLSVFGEHHRTNNVLEGWHSKLNKYLNKNTVTLLRLLNVLRKFQDTNEIKVQNNTNKTKINKHLICNDDVITRVQMELINNYITVGHALDKLRY